MDLNFNSIIDFVSSYFFNGSTTLAGLALLIAAWLVCAIVCLNLKAPPAYSLVPMIPGCIFFSAYGILNETVAVLIIIVCAVMVASQFKKVVD